VFHALDLHDGLIGRGLQHAVVAAAAGWLGSTGRPSASPQKRAASSTSEVLQSISTAQRRERCIAVAPHANPDEFTIREFHGY
jgi:hypothetical protein